MKFLKTNKIPNGAIVFLLLAPITVFFYAIYVFNFSYAGNILLYVFQLTADSIAMFMVTTLWLTILIDMLQSEHNRRDISFDKDWVNKTKPTVDVFIPVANEPLEIIQETLEAVKSLTYPHKTYVLDDGNSDFVNALSKKYEFEYISRPIHNRRYAKSGNVNYGLSFSSGEFFVIFDADHVCQKHFIDELLPLFSNPKVALVQTPQHYKNTDNFIASGTAYAQEIFYKYIQPAKNNYNAAFCVGTNVIFRRSAIDSIGGIAARDHSEDIWTTILLHEKGYDTVFYNSVLASGRAPETISSYFRQQNRWSRGGFTLFFQKNPALIRNLTLDQRVQYVVSNVHYFSGVAICIYLFLPVIYLLTGQHPMNVQESSRWWIHYLPYAATMYLLPYFLVQRLTLSTIATSIASFVPYLQSLLSVVLKNKYKWVATEAKRPKEKPIIYTVWPIVLYLILGTGAIFVGWYNPVDLTTTGLSTFWTLVNMYILLQFLIHGLFLKGQKV